MNLEFTDKNIGGSYGARQVILYNDLWVYKTQRPEYEVTAYRIFEAIRPLKRGHWYVPKTIYFDNEEASLQLFITDAVDFEKVRWRNNGQGNGRDFIDPITAMEVTAFDYLIMNADRHTYNFMLDLAGQIVLIDHGNAFSNYFRKNFTSKIDKDYVVDWTPARQAIESCFPFDTRLGAEVLDRLYKLSTTKLLKLMR